MSLLKYIFNILQKGIYPKGKVVICFFSIVFTFVSCNEKKTVKKEDESVFLQGLWLYSEFDYLSPNESVPVDAAGFIEKHYFWIYNPSEDTILLISEYDEKKYGKGISLSLIDSISHSDKEIELNWRERNKGKVIYPKTGVLGYGLYNVPPVFRENDSLIREYFESRREELMKTALLLKLPVTFDPKYKNVLLFKKGNMYATYLRNVESLNPVMKTLPDGTIKIRSSDTLEEFYMNKLYK